MNGKFAFLVLMTSLVSCNFGVGVQKTAVPETNVSASGTPAETAPFPAPATTIPAGTSSPTYRTPPNGSWHIQYTGDINTDLDVEIYNLDLFDTDPAVIMGLHARGIFVMCYFSAGSFENWRSDANDFPPAVLGLGLEGWEGEQWLDIRRVDLLAPIMEDRLDLAAEKGCDGVDPDNINGYTNDTGFPLTYEDQVRFNIWLAESAHARGLSIGLKNDLEQIPDLLAYFDWQLNEECFQYDECDLLLPFIEAGKPVYQIEYELSNDEFCERAIQLGFQSVRKNRELDEFADPCL